MKKGEGILNFGKAFFEAGTKSVVMNLVKGNDYVSAEIVTRFLHHISKGNRKSKSLNQAKIDFLESEENETFKDPYYWSGFMLVGNDLSLDLNKKLSAYWIGMLIVIVSLIWIGRYAYIRNRLNY